MGRHYSAVFKATVAELVSKHGVHKTLINTWNRKAIEGMAGVYSKKADVGAAERECELGKLTRSNP